MEKTRQSLKRLLAFKQVLKEEYPVKDFVRQQTHQTKTFGHTFGPNSDAEVHKAPMTNVKNNDTYSKLLPNSKRVEFSNGGAEVKNAAFCSFNDDTHANITTLPIDTPKSTKVHFNRDKDYHKHVVNKNGSTVLKYRYFPPKTLESEVVMDVNTKDGKQAERPKKTKVISVDDLPVSTSLPASSVTVDKSHDRILPAEVYNMGFSETRIRQLESRRLEMKEKMTQRIYTRGFDMKTLGSEIDRKLRMGDPERQRKMENKQLLKQSKDTSQR